MPANRFYFEGSLHTKSIQLSGPEFYHLTRVMRIRLGEEVELVDGKGSLARATLTEIQNDHALFTIEQTSHTHPTTPEIILAQGMTKPALLDWIIEKGTELGASQFWLFPGALSDKKEISDHQLSRLRQLAISSLKQCGRLYLPTIECKPPLHEWKKLKGSVLFGSLAQGAAYFETAYSFPLTVIIGPEKGLSQEEISFLQEELQATPVKLHTNTLRAETAALCALSQLSYLFSV